MSGTPDPSTEALSPRAKFERTKDPEDFLLWFSAAVPRSNDEVHALCSWSYVVVRTLAARLSQAEAACESYEAEQDWILAAWYRRGSEEARVVAKICDELDRSGALLGRIRALAASSAGETPE